MYIFFKLGPTALLLCLDLFFSLLIEYTARRKATTYTEDKQTHNKPTQTSIPLLRFEPTVSVLEGAKTVHAFDRAGTVID
jgi:hypothetical protein